MPIYHLKTSTIADGTNTNLVMPSDWNQDHAYTLQEAVVFGGNTTGTLATISSGSFFLAGGNNVTLSQNANSVTIEGPLLMEYEPFDLGPLTFNTSAVLGQNSIYFMPFDVPAPINAYRLNVFGSVGTTWSTTANTGNSGGYTMSAALYERGSGTNTDLMTRIWSGSMFMSVQGGSGGSQLTVRYPLGIDNSTSVSQFSTTFAAAGASSYMAQSLGGYRVFHFPISSTMNAGRYWFAFAQSTTTSGNAFCQVGCSVMNITGQSNYIAFRPFGVGSTASNQAFYGAQPGLGTYSTTTNAMPSSVFLTSSQIRAGINSMTRVYFNISGYPTATNQL